MSTPVYTRALHLVMARMGSPHASPDIRASAACAAYWALADCHGGQGSPAYAELCALNYKPGVCERGPDAGSVDRDVYEQLCTEICKGGR